MTKFEDPWNFIRQDLAARNLADPASLTKAEIKELHEAQLRILPLISNVREVAVNALAEAKPAQVLNMERAIQCDYTVIGGGGPVKIEIYRKALTEHCVALSMSPVLKGSVIETIFPVVEIMAEEGEEPVDGLLVCPRTLVAVENFIRAKEHVLARVCCTRPEADAALALPMFDIGNARH